MKKFAYKTLLLLTLVFIAQMVVGIFCQPHIPKEISALTQALQQKTDVIFLGDSSVFWCGPKDLTTESIVIKVQHKLPAVSIHETSHGGYHLGVFENYCCWMATNANRPRLVIVPINVRTFSPYWDIPGWQFENVRDTLAYLRNPLFRMFYTPLTIFRFFRMETTNEQYLATPVYDGMNKVGTVWDYKGPDSGKLTAEDIKRKFIFFYMGQITEQNRKVQSLRHTARVLKEAGIPALFYFAPIDIQTGMQCHGERFRRQIEQNTMFLKQVIHQEGAISRDFTCALGTEDFVWPVIGDCVDEHLKEPGRQFVADRLSETIATEFPNLLQPNGRN